MSSEEEKMDDSDLAIAIGEHAFIAGFEAGFREGYMEGMPGTKAKTAHEAWSEYTPPEDLCGRSFKHD